MSYYVSFPDWIDQLKRDCAPKAHSWAITLRWYLGWCKRSRQPATIPSARAFMDEVLEAKQPSAGIANEWKTAINWFFRHGQRKCLRSSKAPSFRHEQSESRSLPPELDKQWNRPRANEPSPKWQHEVIRLIRVRQYQWQTEKTYVHWLKRLATFHQRTDLENLDNAQIATFLDDLAVRLAG